MADDMEPVGLLQLDTPEWRLWAAVAELSSYLKAREWVLIGGQMVALHLHLAGVQPSRTTADIDIVADILAVHSSYTACKNAASKMNLEPEPSITGNTLHRFAGPLGQLDLMVPDHLPGWLKQKFTRPTPVVVPGGQRAIDRRIIVAIRTTFGDAEIPVPDLQGALVVKARAAIADTKDRERHCVDLAQLSTIIDNPLGFRDGLDIKEKRYLRKVGLDEDVTKPPWLHLDDPVRQRSLDAWFTLIAS
jgi:predicted nucleotidyltransferase